MPGSNKRVRSVAYIDSDNNGLPDAWEVAFLGGIGNDPTSLSPAGDGYTLLQEYQLNRDPLDFYQGMPPTLTVTSGNNQSGTVGEFLSQPLIVTVTDSLGHVLPNAPIQFSVTQGQGLVSSSNTGTPTPSNSAQVSTDQNGKAQAYLQASIVPGETSIVTVSAEGTSVNFTSTNPAPTTAPAATTLTVTPGGTGQVILNWTGPAGNPVTSYLVQELISGTWNTIATVSPGVTTYTLSNGNSSSGALSFRIISVNSIGQSSPSISESAIPTPIPPPVTVPTMFAEWEVADITQYGFHGLLTSSNRYSTSVTSWNYQDNFASDDPSSGTFTLTKDRDDSNGTGTPHFPISYQEFDPPWAPPPPSNAPTVSITSTDSLHSINVSGVLSNGQGYNRTETVALSNQYTTAAFMSHAVDLTQFTNTFTQIQNGGETGAFYFYSPSTSQNDGNLQLESTQYYFAVPAGTTQPVAWIDNIFTENGGIETFSYNFQTWSSGGATTSPTYALSGSTLEAGPNSTSHQINLVNTTLSVYGVQFGSANAVQTTQTNPFRFWVNNDEDNIPLVGGAKGSEFVEKSPYTAAAHPDFALNTIPNQRDLEDWAPMSLSTSGLDLATITGGATFKIGLKWKTIVSGSPGIKIVEATGQDTGNIVSYTFDQDAASSQLVSAIASDSGGNTNVTMTGGAADFVFPQSVWDDESGSTGTVPGSGAFLFEATSPGFGQLEVVILSGDGTTVLAEGASVWLDLRDVKELYLRAMAGPQATAPYKQATPAVPTIKYSIDNQGQGSNSGKFIPDPSEVTDPPTYIVYVHGYNQTYSGSTNFAETMYKRLWWQGYRGRFAAFRWPTFGDGTVPTQGEIYGGAVGTYNDSEYQAWQSGAALKKFVTDLETSGYTVEVVSHSMGSIVVAEALKEGMTVDHYVMLHGAATASCYDAGSFVFPEATTPSTLGRASPDNDTDPTTQNLAYKAWLKAIQVSPINFYDTADSVIGAIWMTNNVLFKPQIVNQGYRIAHPLLRGFSPGYFYKPNNAATQKLGLASAYYYLPLTNVNRYLTDPGEAKAYADFSLTTTIGGSATPAGNGDTPLTYGVVTGGIDENSDGYNFGDEHSSEFSRTIQQDSLFYETLLGFQGFVLQ